MTTSKLKDITFFSFLAFSVLLIAAYLVLLYTKVTSPTFEQLQTDDFVWLGILVLGFITTDFLIVRRFIRRSKKR